jgi:fatty-acyl-CoA synthase
MRQAAQRLGMTGIVSCYGQTEAGSIVTHGLPGDPAPKRLETAGRPIPFQELKLVDPQSGCTVGPGEEGEIWDRSPYQMLGYRRMSEATAATLVEGGWLRTGDLGRQDTDGFLTIIGRLKDLIIRGGENICPTKVERELLTHPDVLEAYVVGIPSREYGEEVCVCLLLRPGARLDLGEEVQRHLNPRLAYYELPRYVLKMEAFPLIANGKVRRRELAALEVDLLTAQGEVILRAEERQQQ